MVTASAMLAELYRRDRKGFVKDRQPKDKLVLTCRFVAIMMASILKSKGIPIRVRAGHVPYFDMGELGDISTDHWINQYWSNSEKRWITIDVDGSLSLKDEFDPYDIPDGKFDFAADIWLNIRAGKVDPKHFYNASGYFGEVVVLWSLFYDFHSLMNSEIIYLHNPKYSNLENFDELTKADLKKIDNLAKLMQKPDENLEKLIEIWNKDKDFRLLTGALL